MPSSLEIAQEATLRPIAEIAAAAGLLPDEIEPYGRYKAKIDLSVLERLADQADGKLIDVTAITPTKAGEGKTTTSVSLTQGLGHIGKSPVLCLREASLGPVFGIKGGAAGGGYTQVVPMEDMNLHFTGDIHAIGAANNLLAAMLEAHLLHGNKLGDRPALDQLAPLPRHQRPRPARRRGRARRPRERLRAPDRLRHHRRLRGDGDRRRRLRPPGPSPAARRDHRRARRSTASPSQPSSCGAAGAMTVLLKDTIKPNLVQTLEGQPALVHCGPFANIAHGNNSLVADRVALKLGDYVVTESGFGSDMGMEKFFHIVCRAGNLRPDAVVLVATVKALKHHAGDPDGGIEAIEAGAANLARHIGIVREFGINPVVAVNRFPGDTDRGDRARARARARGRRVRSRDQRRLRAGRRGSVGARRGRRRCCGGAVVVRLPLPDRRADRGEDRGDREAGVRRRRDLPPEDAKDKIQQFTQAGLDRLPICMAKTHLSLSHDAALANAPTGFTVTVRDLRAYTGAGWIVALCGDMQTMPGYGATPAAFNVDIDADGTTVGLF